MKLRQLVIGYILLFFVGLAGYAGLKTDGWKSLIITIPAFYLGLMYVSSDLNNYSKLKQNGIIKINADKEEKLRGLITLVSFISGFIFFLYIADAFPKTSSDGDFVFFYSFTLFLVLVFAYRGSFHGYGLYRNGKYLGHIRYGWIKVADDVKTGKTMGYKTSGTLTIHKNNRLLLELKMTPESFSILSPENLSKIFPDIPVSVEKSELSTDNLHVYRAGDYTITYDLRPVYVQNTIITTTGPFIESWGVHSSGSLLSDEIRTNPVFKEFSGNEWHI